MKLFEAGSLWSYKGYRLFWYNTTIFVLGASAFPIALAVTVLDAGGTATSLGLILGARVLAAVVFSPFAGVWSDRLPRKQVMIVADLFRAIIVFGMVFISAPKLPHILLALAVFLMGIGDAFGMASAGAIMPSLVVVVYGNRKRFLGTILADDILIEEIKDLVWLWKLG